MTFCNYLEMKLLDHVFGNQAYTAPTPLYVGLATAIAEDGTITGEPSTNNYARVSVTNNNTNWPNCVSDGSKDNGVAIQFNEATGNWGTMTKFFISNASSGNNNTLAYGDLTTGKTIESGDTPKFNIGDLDITLE